MATDILPEPQSPSSTSTGMKRRHSPSLSIDLSDLPALSQPSPPSNTLLITNLADPLIFTEQNLHSIRDAINLQAPLHSFVPLKSFRRIIAIFYDIDSATTIRKVLDGESVLGHRIRVYFGEQTDLQEKDQHLSAPQPQKLFFISPPPSPPMGWEMRNEEPPNKEVHAQDLATALDRLNALDHNTSDFPPSPTSVKEGGVQRSRSSTIVFDPADHGGSPHLPAIAVEDTSDVESPIDEGPKPMVHTARPPVELMEE